MTQLAERSCEKINPEQEPLDSDQIEALSEQVPDWEVEDDERIWRTFEFDNFAQALAFVNRVGELAEHQRHHPDISLSYGMARVELSTHSIGGLSDNDFILAAKIDKLLK